MKSKFKYISTSFLIIVLFLFGFFLYNGLRINKTREIIAVNDTLFDASDVSLKELDVYDIATSSDRILVKSFTKAELQASINYSVNVNYNVAKVNLRAVANDGKTSLTGNGSQALKQGANTFTFTTTSSNGSTGTFTLTINRENFPSGNHSSKLYSLQIKESNIEYILPIQNDYTITIPSGWYFMELNAVAYDSDATVTPEAECFDYVPETTTCKIVVTDANASPSETTYNITLFKKDAGTSTDYSYKGYSQKYTAPYTGYYRLEAWGAQGGSDGSTGGYGGYSVGAMHMDKGDSIWVTVGGKGSDCSSGGGGGYNGGGNAGPSGCSGAGGGATHFAFTSGTLASKPAPDINTFDGYTVNSTDIIMVAGGGGGAGWRSSTGSGGGRIGTKGNLDECGDPGTQAKGGNGHDDGEYGHGGNRISGDGGGGGGGFYGGGASNGDSGGGGGSGYIGNISLESIYGITKHMTCYYCEENDLSPRITTRSTGNVSTNALADHAKRGNGFASVSYLDLSENYYLSNLEVIDPSTKERIPYDTVIPNEETLFKYNVTDYDITLPSDQTRIYIHAATTDPKLRITGDLEEVLVPAYDHDFKITTTSEYGVTKTYTITTHRPPSDSVDVHQININGLLEKYCKNDFDANANWEYKDEHDLLDFCDLYYPLTINGYIGSAANYKTTPPDKTDWTANIHTYDLVVPQRIKAVQFEVVKDNENQEITGGGEVTLSAAQNSFYVDVISEKCYLENPAQSEDDIVVYPDGCVNGYVFNIYRDYYHDADLAELYINSDETFEDDDGVHKGFDLNFTDPAVLDYYFSVPNSWTYVKDLVAIPDINGYNGMNGINDAHVEILDNEPGTFAEAGKTYIVTVRVTAPDNVVIQDYKLHVYRGLNKNVFLESLKYLNKDVVEIAMTPAFNKKIFNYSVVVPTNNAVGYVRFKPAQPETSSVKLYRAGQSNNPIQITPNIDLEYFGELPLKRGDNEFVIEVTAQNGDKGYYTIYVNRLLSDDSSISGIIAKTNDKLWTLVPTFDPDQLHYDIEVDPGTSFVDLIPITNDEKATYEILEGKSITYTSTNLGYNEKTLRITSEDGTSSREYTFTIHRPPFTDSALYGISVTSSDQEDATIFPINPTFDSATFEYSVDVPNEVTNVWIWYETNGHCQNVTTNYNNGSEGVSLHTGANVFTFESTAEDGSSTTNYKLTINRAINTNVTLGSLSIKFYDQYNNSINGTINEPVNAYTTDYTSTAPYYARSATLTVVPSVNTVQVVPEHPSTTLNYGPNVITFKLQTDENPPLYEQDYTVTVTRVFNPDCGLSYLTLEDEFGNYHPLTPSFDPMILNYEANVSNKSDYVIIHAGSSSKTAKITGTGKHNLNYGPNVYEVVVSNYDTNTNTTYSETYTLKVTRNYWSDPCPDEIELYYPTNGYGDTIHWYKNYSGACEEEEYNVIVRKPDKLFVRVKSPDGVPQNTTVLGLPNSYTKGGPTQTFYVIVKSQDGTQEVTYTFNVTYPEYIGSNYLANLQVKNGDTEYPVKQAANTSLNFDKTVEDYKVTVTIPYNVPEVNIIATPEDPQARIAGAGVKGVPTNRNDDPIVLGQPNGADNEFTIVVTPASDVDDQTTRTYTIIINREHGHEARLNTLSAYYTSPFPDVIPSVEEYKFYDSSALTTEKAFDKDTYSGYYMRIDSYADHPLGAKNFHYTKVDPNATANFPNLSMPNSEPTEYDYDIVVYAEDGLEITKKTYTIKVRRLKGTIAYLSGLCLYNDTDEKCETLYPAPQSGDLWESINFHPLTETYYAYVDSSFDKNHGLTAKELNPDNVIVTLFDGAASLTRTNPTVTLVRDNWVEYEFKIASEDGNSNKTYKLYVMLKLGDDPRIKTVSFPKGFLLNKTKYFLGYDPEETTDTEYYWIIPDAYYNDYSDENFSYTMFDRKAWSEKLYDSNNKIITINTKSEDGDHELTYKFIMKRYSDVNVAAKQLNIFDANLKDPDDDTLPFEYPYTPDLEDFVFEYTTHVYVSSTALNIKFKVKDSGCVVNGPTNPIPLSGTEQDIIYYVTSPDGTFTVPYKIHVIRDILDEKNASDLYLIDEGTENGPICKGQHCILEPTFDPDRSGYYTVIPYEYEHMYFYVGLNSQQTARFFDGNMQEIDNRTYRVVENEGTDLVKEGYVIPLGESEVRINIYDGLGVLTNYYLVQFNKKKSNDATLSSLKVKKVKETPDEGDTYYSLDRTFDPDIDKYTVFVPKDTTAVDIEYETTHPGAQVSIQGNTGLEWGINKVLVTVLAQDGETQKQYIVYVNVGIDYRSFLANITVSTGLQFYDLTPEFYKSETEYYVVVPSSTTQAIVEGTVETSITTVIGNDSYELTTGNNDIYIKGRYYDGDELKSETVYHVRIYRRYPNNVRLSDLRVYNKGTFVPLTPEFDTGTTNYSLSVPAGTTSLQIHATPEYPESTVTVVGNNNLKGGFNIINVYVVNDTRTLTKTYQLSVFVRPSNDASLAMIDVYTNATKSDRLGVKNFDSTVHTYNMEVPSTQDSVYIVATPNVSTATIEGAGFNALQYGENEIEIKVTAEDGTEHLTYIVNIYRNYNLLLKELTYNIEDTYPLDPEFDPLVNEYRITVPFDVKSIKFNAVAEAGSAVNLAYNAVNYLEIGENKVKFTITDKKGNRNVYVVTIDRVGSANNYLAALVPAQGMLTEDFARDIQSYTLLLPNNLKFCDITDWIITPEDEYATYEVSGHESFDPTKSGQQIKIVVTAQNGAKRTYTLTLEFLPPEYFKHYLSALWLDNDKVGTELVNYGLSPKYDMDIGSYTSTMPYGTDKVTIHAVPINSSDKVYIDGKWSNDPSLPSDETHKKEVDLKFGRNVFKVRVDGGAAGYKIYTLIIYRTSSPDATLANLIVEGYTYTPIFNKLITDYYLSVPTSVKDLDVTYLASDPASTVVITGNTNLDPTKAENLISVEVTSPDGVTKQTYYVHVKMEKDKDNYLADLIVQGYELDPAFKPTNTGAYEVKVPNTVSKVLVYGDAQSATSVVTISDGTSTFTGLDIVSGAIKLKPGNNYVQVTVTADSGDIRVYTVNIFKEYKTISSLLVLYTDYKDGSNGLSISQNGYLPSFDPATLVYYETVDYNENGFYNVIGIKTDADSTMVSPGSTKLKEGLNEIDIVVTAEDKVTTTTYKLYVTMEKGPSTKLANLTVSEGQLDPAFDKDTLYYYVEVPSEVTKLDFLDTSNNPNGIDLIVPEDPNATYTVSGNSSFTQNSVSTVTITVKCGGSATQCATVPDTVYTIDVYRSIMGDDKLDQLYIKNYPFTPTFAPLTLKYTREVETDVDKVTVGAFRTNSDATITINGVTKSGTGGEEQINLDYGDNYVYVNVVASNGAKRTYQIVITRKDTANFLTQLESNTGTWTLTPTESLLKTQFDYELSLPDGVTKVKLKGNWTDGATVTNIDHTYTDINVPAGSNLVYKITVTSGSGDSNIYNVTIHGAKSAKTDMTLDTDRGTPDYIGDNKYELTVKDDASTIQLIVTPADEGALVIKQPYYALQYGETTIKFQVKSSDGTKIDEYTLIVTRGKDIEKIIPDKAEIVLVVDEEETITYKIEPLDATSTDVQFVSKHSSIATVASDGKVKGIAEGKTIVEIQSVKDPGIKGEVTVHVLDKKISSDTYKVAHKDETDNPYNLYNLDYTAGFEQKTTINDFLDNFNNPATYLHVYENNVEITDYTRYVGSAMVLKLEIGGKTYDEITIIVKGDMGTYDSPGNGIVTATDRNSISQVVAGLETLTDLKKAMMDIDDNALVTATDLSSVSSFIAGLIPKLLS